MKKRRKYGLPNNPKDHEFFQSVKEYCSKIELQSLNNLEQNKNKSEKMDLEFDQEEEPLPKNLSFNNEKNIPTFANNFPFQEKEKSNKGLKRSASEKMDLEKDDYNYENYNFLNFDKISLSGGEQEEGVELFIDSKNNKTYKFVDDMTFECDEI